MMDNILELQNQADAGDKGALFLLGERFRTGDGVEKNPVRALYYYSLASEFGVKKADILIGNAYENGVGCKKDFKMAEQFYRSAVQHGFLNAYTALGKLFEKTKKSGEIPFKYYKKAVENGDTEGALCLGKVYFLGEALPRDLKMAKEYFALAEAQFAQASYFLGLILQEEKADLTQIAQHFAIAATAGITEAKTRYADCLLCGRGVEKNENLAFKFLEEAYAEGDKNSIFLLAKCYLEGLGGKINIQKGAQFLELAVQQNNTDAMFLKAELLEHGRSGYKEDMESAAIYYKNAMELGNIDAEALYGKMLILGIGEEANIEKAFQHIKHSAEQNSGFGIYFLAYCYEKGFCVNIDFKTALSYYKIAKENNILDASVRYALIEERLKCSK